MKKLLILVCLFAINSAYAVDSKKLTEKKSAALITALKKAGVTQRSHIESSELEVRNLNCHNNVLRSGSRAICSLINSVTESQLSLSDKQAADLMKALKAAGVKADDRARIQVSEINCSYGYDMRASRHFSTCTINQ